MAYSVCVYCGSREGDAGKYRSAAEAVADGLAEEGMELVYGGGQVGLMGVVARRMQARGGKVTGIIPDFLKRKEILFAEADKIVTTTSMHARKQQMFERSDAFVTLPGGIGTLDELVEMMTWRQLDRHTRPIVVLNTDGYWDPLFTLFDHMASEGFLHKDLLKACVSVEKPEDVVPAIRAVEAEQGRRIA